MSSDARDKRYYLSSRDERGGETMIENVAIRFANWRRGVLVMYTVLTASACWAQAPLTLQGRIGTAPVVLEVGTGYPGGRYFYRQHHFDIPIDADVQSEGVLVLHEGITRKTNASATMRLRKEGDGAWRGTWTDSQGRKSLRVELFNLAADATASALPTGAEVPGLSVYERERLRDLPLHPDNLDTVAGRKLQWWLEPVTGVRVFRLNSGYPAAALARLNGRFLQEQNKAIAQFFECNLHHLLQYGLSQRSDFEFKVTPRLLSDKLLSVSISMVGECGNSQVQVTNSALNVYIPTMRELDLTDLIWGDGGKSNEDLSARSFWLAVTMSKMYPLKMADLNERCSVDDDDIWNAPNWFITPDGLSLEPHFQGNKQAPCGGEWLLPWALVNQHPGKLRIGLP